MKVYAKPVLLAVALAVSFALGYFIHAPEPRTTFAVREYDERYPYIKPLLICQIDEQEQDRELTPLKKEVEDILSQEKKVGNLTNASVYFRLSTARWMGINENEPHPPASLLKLPLMMAYFKKSEDDPSVLDRRYAYVREANDINPLVTAPLLKSGNSYSAEDLIEGMITQSDNSAKDVLYAHADSASLKETYGVLGIADPYASSTQPYEITAKAYALFFRVLYNGTYLSRELSNRAAELLTKVEFSLGLRAGTPENIAIAHKYGVDAQKQSDGSYKVSLSDCGIVYASSPYLLCVMVDGKDPYALASVIAKVAQAAYRSSLEQ